MLKFSHILPNKEDPKVPDRHEALSAFLGSEGVDALVVTTQDAFLSEYNYVNNNQRYYLSGFSGSTGDGIFYGPQHAKSWGGAQFVLVVDGRYQLQAKHETDPNYVRLINLTLSASIAQNILDSLDQSLPEGATVGLDALRVSYLFYQKLAQLAEKRNWKMRLFLQGELDRSIRIQGWSSDRAIRGMSSAYTGRTMASIASSLQLSAASDKRKTCIATIATDDVAFLLNARAYHTANASSVMGYVFLIDCHAVLFLPQGSSDKAPVELPQFVNGGLAERYELHVVRGSVDTLRKTLSRLGAMVTNVVFDDRKMNVFAFDLMQQLWPKASIQSQYRALESLRAIKTRQEYASIKDSFIRSSRAIARTMRWVKQCALESKVISEMDMCKRIQEEYGAEGALEISFYPIAATGANGAFIHYTKADDANKMQQGDLVLLDSGAYYEHGFATDCTRGVWFGDVTKNRPAQWQRDVYTTVVAACAEAMMAEVPEGTECKLIDAMARNICRAKGYDYAHGTGHGVGIHVHEGGVGFSTVSPYHMIEGLVGSIEPGIYLEGKGGVRIENVAYVSKHPSKAGMVCFENFVFVGLDWDVMDVNQLSDKQKEYLKQYEAECRALGTHVTECPL